MHQTHGRKQERRKNQGNENPRRGVRAEEGDTSPKYTSSQVSGVGSKNRARYDFGGPAHRRPQSQTTSQHSCEVDCYHFTQFGHSNAVRRDTRHHTLGTVSDNKNRRVNGRVQQKFCWTTTFPVQVGECKPIHEPVGEIGHGMLAEQPLKSRDAAAHKFPTPCLVSKSWNQMDRRHGVGVRQVCYR